MNTIPKAETSRVASLKNPSFERKVELYNSVVEKINLAVSQGKKSFTVSEAEYYALHKEILEKGYKEDDGTFIGAMATSINIRNFVITHDSIKKQEESPYKTYYFN